MREKVQEEFIRNEIPTECKHVEVILGPDLEQELRKNKTLGNKMEHHNIPDTRQFRIFKYKNPRTLRYLMVMKCDHNGCQSIFRKWHNFYNHLRIHTKEKPFKCPFAKEHGCNLMFSQRSNLNKHIKNFHSGKSEIDSQMMD